MTRLGRESTKLPEDVVGLNLIQFHAAKAFRALLQTTHVTSIDFQAGSGLPLGTLNGAGIISASHQSALEALSENQISRAAELGLGTVDVGEVLEAEAI